MSNKKTIKELTETEIESTTGGMLSLVSGALTMLGALGAFFGAWELGQMLIIIVS